MAKVIIDLGVPDLVIGSLTWGACQRKRDNATVSILGSTLTAFDTAGKYWLENPNVTETTFFYIYITATPSTALLGEFIAASSLAICNNAILALGGNVISSFDDASSEAVLCKNLWQQALDTVLRLHPWNCGVKRITLTPDAAPPVYAWTAAFSLPSDLVRLLEVDGLTEYKIEGRKILCDEAELNIRYVYRNEAADQWDALFVSSMTAYMAFNLAYAITKSNTTRKEQWTLFTDMLRTARNVDAQEEPPETIGDFPFLNVRG